MTSPYTQSNRVTQDGMTGRTTAIGTITTRSTTRTATDAAATTRTIHIRQTARRDGQATTQAARINPTVVPEVQAKKVTQPETAVTVALARTATETKIQATAVQAEQAATTPTTVQVEMQAMAETEAMAETSSQEATEEPEEMAETEAPTEVTLVTVEMEGMADQVGLESGLAPVLPVDLAAMVEMPAIRQMVMPEMVVMVDPEEPEAAVKAGQVDRAALVVTLVQAVMPPTVTEEMVELEALEMVQEATEAVAEVVEMAATAATVTPMEVTVEAVAVKAAAAAEAQAAQMATTAATATEVATARRN